MSLAVAPTDLAAEASGARLEHVGVRFDFDRLSRVVTPMLGRLRRPRSSAWGLRGIDLRIGAGEGVAGVGPTGAG